MKLFCAKTFLKSISWRFFATAITAAISYGVTKDFGFAWKIITADFLIKTISFYFHEKLWEIKNG